MSTDVDRWWDSVRKYDFFYPYLIMDGLSFHWQIYHIWTAVVKFFRDYFGKFLDNHQKCFFEFPSAKIQYWKCEVKYLEDFFSKKEKSSFKKSEAVNLLIINDNSWFSRLIFSIQKNQNPRRKEIVYSRKTWRRI